jgi:hypothetical protein
MYQEAAAGRERDIMKSGELQLLMCQYLYFCTSKKQENLGFTAGSHSFCGWATTRIVLGQSLSRSSSKKTFNLCATCTYMRGRHRRQQRSQVSTASKARQARTKVKYVKQEASKLSKAGGKPSK